MGARRMVLVALYTAAALILGLLDSAIPLPAFIPLPGVRLGLANIAGMLALLTLGAPMAFLLTLCRCLLGALVSGNAFALVYSLGAGLLAMAAMALARRFYPRHMSIWGISMAGATAHNLAQVGIAALIIQDTAVFILLPPLILLGGLTATLTALIAKAVMKRLPEGTLGDT